MQQQIDRCGDCHSCCKSFGEISSNLIELINLDIQYEYGRCNKLCSDNRCTIYETRPKSCAEFECLYVESDLPIEFLPETVGFVTDLRIDAKGSFLNIVPNESRKHKIDPQTFYDENYDNINVMKTTAEDVWSVKIINININSDMGEIDIEC